MTNRLLAFFSIAFMPSASAESFDADAAWQWACEWSQYSCEGVERPRFVIGFPEGDKGTYRGTYSEGVVYLNPYLIPGVDMQSTAIHETVHHLQAVVAGHPSAVYYGDPAMETLCRDEEEAFSVVDTWWRHIGMSDQQRGPNWWWSYGHCYQYYDPDWEPFDWSFFIDNIIDDLIEELIR